ncbi:MAG: hybrid sensor histidine kinase/response regulator, partial [Deltaproteobacteria bacterium]|nr:hybrid sensor histidine kinase/response regulator [Deltaproteobacteria bacterium]
MARVLIAESNKVTADFVAETLEKAGHVTMATSRLTEALAIFQEHRPDLVLVNYFLTEGDGLSFLETLLNLAPTAAAVMTTGLGNENMACQAMRLGAYDYIVKGQTYFQDLPGIVADCLSRRERINKKATIDNLSHRLSAQAELAGWLDHNFKNILSAIAGSLSLIELENPDQSNEKRREYLSDSLDSLKTGLKLLDQLSRMMSMGSVEDEKTVSVSQIVDDAWRSITSQLRNGPIGDFSISPDILTNLYFINDTRDLPPMRLVGQDLSTILEALIKNAIEAVGNSKEPRIIVRAKRTDDYLFFSVEDNGRGMDDKVQRHAFEPLFSTKG